MCRGQLKCDGMRTETRFCLSAKWMSPFKLAGASVQLITGSRGVRISGSNAGYTMFRGSVKGTGYPLYLPDSPSLPLLCITVCHHISTGVYFLTSIHSWAEGLAFGPNFRIGWDTLCFTILLMWTSNGSFSNWNKSFQKRNTHCTYACLHDNFKLMWMHNHNLLKNWKQFSKSPLQ